MNARYYDPELGQFLSPDTQIPDPLNLFDYNRYMFVHGNPLRFNDPTGHETSKPDWWPDVLPYTLDLPDGMTKVQFTEWVSENNIPTTIGAQGGVDLNATLGTGVSASGELGWMFNWWSGELAYQGTASAGLVAGPTANLGGGAHGGVTWVAGARGIESSIEGFSRYYSANAQADIIAKAGLSGTWSQSIPSNQVDPDILLLSQMGNSYIDQVFDRTVDGLALNGNIGLDAAPTVLDVSFGTGFAQTKTASVNLYTPIINTYNWLFSK